MDKQKEMDEQKEMARLMKKEERARKNRVYAQQSRERKNNYIDALEYQIKDLNNKITYLNIENQTLKNIIKIKNEKTP